MYLNFSRGESEMVTRQISLVCHDLSIHGSQRITGLQVEKKIQVIYCCFWWYVGQPTMMTGGTFFESCRILVVWYRTKFWFKSRSGLFIDRGIRRRPKEGGTT
jgi:hypothetical protein